MNAIVSLMDEKHYSLVESLWQELEETFGFKGVRVTPFPHFSWSLAQQFDYPELDKILSSITSTVRPLQVTTTGIGLFTGEKPVIYLPVVKTVELMRYHALIWQLTAPASRERSNYYAPQHWMPHISLAYDDVSKQNIGPVMEKLAFMNFDWQISVNNIAVIHEPAGSVGTLRHNYKLTGTGSA